MAATPTVPSLWSRTLPEELRVRGAPLDGDVEVDVAIVGAGMTGLWTAHSLAVADPRLRIAVVERDVIGFGASGRNGGWCSALLPMSVTTVAARHGPHAAIRMQQAMQDTVDEVGRALSAGGVDAHYVKGGTVTVARSAAQSARLDAEVAEARRFGFGPDDLVRLDAAEAVERCRATNVVGGLYTPHCAAVHPARLVHGLARMVTELGVRIHERTAARDVDRGAVLTEAGRVRAEVVVLATEAYVCRLPGRRRDLIPLYSLMVATDPLPRAVWDEIGLAGRPTFHDGRRMIIYGQRTADDRLAFGGRGAPYHFGSRIDPSFDTDLDVRDALVRTARDLFPVLAEVPFPYHWGGPLGVPRDWHAAVRFDREAGLAFAGGYVGDGVATTNLAGRTLADLITGRRSDLTDLPLVDHRSRRWEPEPLRWLGVNLARAAAGRADAAEGDRTRRSERAARVWGGIVDRLTGG